MPDFMDLIQDHEAVVNEALNASARLPTVAPCAARDCDGCGKPIDPRRLKVVPSAIRCVWCEETHGQRSRHFGGRPRA